MTCRTPSRSPAFARSQSSPTLIRSSVSSFSPSMSYAFSPWSCVCSGAVVVVIVVCLFGLVYQTVSFWSNEVSSCGMTVWQWCTVSVCRRSTIWQERKLTPSNHPQNHATPQLFSTKQTRQMAHANTHRQQHTPTHTSTCTPPHASALAPGHQHQHMPTPGATDVQ